MNIILLEKILFQSYALPFLDVIHKDIVLLKEDLATYKMLQEIHKKVCPER